MAFSQKRERGGAENKREEEEEEEGSVIARCDSEIEEEATELPTWGLYRNNEDGDGQVPATT